MYYYFSCDYPAAIKFNGIYYGVISETVKSIRIDGKLPLVEICPLSPNENQLTFIPDENFIYSPPEGVLVTDLDGGYLIKILKNYRVGDFSVLCQQKFPNLVATVFIENGLKISIETPGNFFADTLDFFASDASIIRFSLSSSDFVAVVLSGKEKLLTVYSIKDKIQKVFSRTVCDFSSDGGFYTTEHFSDIAKHTVFSEWQYSDFKFIQINKSVKRSENFVIPDLPDKILPFAFLEELLVGGCVDDFLDDNLKENSDKLKEYLGEFIGIMPPPVFRQIDEIGLVYCLKKNKYNVKYCTFEIKDKKIVNIKKQ